MSDVQEAFRQARIHAHRHMSLCEDASVRWGETSITELVVAHASSAVSVIPFTQGAEALSGADWIWWWVDPRGSYGMLVQAKRLTVNNARWRFGFDYLTGKSKRSQRDALLETAAALDLLPAYALYLGTPSYRGWERCSAHHWKSRCLHCIRRTVSLMPAILATDMSVDGARSTYERSVALEELWNPPTDPALIIPTLTREMSTDLRDFLRTRQDGTRAVARSMIDRVLRSRIGQFSNGSSQTISLHAGDHDELGPVFGEVPGDTTHGGVRYLEHLLRPLRSAPPSYVVEIMTGDVNVDRLRGMIQAEVAGIVVVNTPIS